MFMRSEELEVEEATWTLSPLLTMTSFQVLECRKFIPRNTYLAKDHGGGLDKSSSGA